MMLHLSADPAAAKSEKSYNIADLARQTPATAVLSLERLRGSPARAAVPLRVIEQHLQRQQDAGQRHLAADRFTVADLCVASVLNWARPARELMRAHPLTHDWIVRCVDRSAHLAAKALGEV